jgi:hypothetical protein
VPFLVLSNQGLIVGSLKGQYFLHLVFRVHTALITTVAEVIVFTDLAMVALALDWVFGNALVAEVLLRAKLLSGFLPDRVTERVS